MAAAAEGAAGAGAAGAGAAGAGAAGEAAAGAAGVSFDTGDARSPRSSAGRCAGQKGVLVVRSRRYECRLSFFAHEPHAKQSLCQTALPAATFSAG